MEIQDIKKGSTMSISMEKFAAEHHFETFDPYVQSVRRVAVYGLQCRCCGFEPEDTVVAPRICSKCHSHAWERFPKPRGTLENAERYAV
jgi:predicted Zn-ribbon and HTH transcriptional regulator